MFWIWKAEGDAGVHHKKLGASFGVPETSSLVSRAPSGVPTLPRNCVMSPLLESFLVAKTAAGLSVRTLSWYRLFIAGFLDFCECRSLDQKQPETVEAYLAELRSRQVSPHTVSGCYRALSVWFGWLVKRGLLAVSPLHTVQRPRLPQKRAPYVRPAEFDLLLASIRGSDWTDARDRALLLALYYSGLRVAEALALTACDIDGPRRLLTVVSGKGDKTRLVPCHPQFVSELAAYRAGLPADPLPCLFVSNDGAGGIRGPLTPNGLRQMMRRRCAQAALPYLHPHAFRHGFAMLFLNNGMEMSAVSAAMGHSSVSVTESVYARWLPNGLLRQYDAALRRASVFDS